MAAETGIRHHMVQKMMEILGYQKVFACWVHHSLTEEHKIQPKNISSQLMKRNAIGGDDFLHSVMTNDRSWKHFELLQSTEWHHKA
jgi:hypothetical protein